MMPSTFCKDQPDCHVANGVGDGKEIRQPIRKLLHNPGKRYWWLGVGL